MAKRIARAFILGHCVLLSLGARDAVAQVIELPQITVNAPSPIVRRAPGDTLVPAITGLTLQSTLPIVTDQFATVTVVPTEEIQRSTGATLGDVLFAKPGITSSSFAPGAASRPVVRGLDNNRVRIQENGLTVGDASDLGEDHGVPIDPLGARQIQVIRGPASLRWGSQAIGGVINADNNRIPTAIPLRGFAAEFNTAATSVDRGLDGAVLLDAGKDNFAFHADAYSRRAGDYGIPNYPYLPPADQTLRFDGRQPNSSLRADGQAVGGSYLFDGGYFGVAVAQFASLYRVPGVEATATDTRIDLKQTKVTGKGEFRPQASAIAGIRFWLGYTDYRHHELANEGGFDGIQQTFTNKSGEARVEVQLTPLDLRFAALTTAFGVQAARQDLTAPGAEGGLFDPNRTTSIAGFLFNEFKFTDAFRMQLAGRIEQVHVTGAVPDVLIDPALSIARDKTYTPKNVAIGFLHDLPWDMVGSLTAQYVERAPRAAELFSLGVHEATGTFDIGDPNLKVEVAKSVEVGIRRAKGPLRFEATAFYTRYLGFIFRRLTGVRCGEDFASCGIDDELDQSIYSQRDVLFRGGEAQFQWDAVPLWAGFFGIDGQYDIVRATFADGSNVPRIPPQRIGAGVYFRNAEWLARVNLLHAFAQKNVAAGAETPTDGYILLKAELSYTHRFKDHDAGLRQITVGIVGNNLLNDDIRNAVSYKKNEVLMPGRTVRLFTRLLF